jgi:hypothetical protein
MKTYTKREDYGKYKPHILRMNNEKFYFWYCYKNADGSGAGVGSSPYYAWLNACLDNNLP